MSSSRRCIAPPGELNDVGGDFYDVLAYGARALDAGDRRRLRQGTARGGRDGARAPHAARRRDARSDTRPAMLDTLHEALRRQPAGADLCTVCLVTLEPLPARARADGRARRASAAAADRRRRRAAGTVGEPGTLLGVLDPIDISEVERRAALPARRCCCTPTGCRRPAAQGCSSTSASVRAVRGQRRSRPSARMLEQVERGAVQRAQGRLRDDIALLAVRLAARATSASAAGVHASRRLDAERRPSMPAISPIKSADGGPATSSGSTCDTKPGRVILALAGELDMASAEALQQAIDERGAAACETMRRARPPATPVHRLHGPAHDPDGARALPRARAGVRDHARLASRSSAC